MAMVPRLPSSWRTSAGPASMIAWISGPTVVPNRAMKGMMAMAIMLPAILVERADRMLRIDVLSAGLSAMPMAKA